MKPFFELSLIEASLESVTYVLVETDKFFS